MSHFRHRVQITVFFFRFWKEALQKMIISQINRRTSCLVYRIKNTLEPEHQCDLSVFFLKGIRGSAQSSVSGCSPLWSDWSFGTRRRCWCRRSWKLSEIISLLSLWGRNANVLFLICVGPCIDPERLCLQQHYHFKFFSHTHWTLGSAPATTKDTQSWYFLKYSTVCVGKL